MESGQVSVQIRAKATSQSPSLGLFSTVFIAIQLTFQEFIGDHLLSRLGSSLLPPKQSQYAMRISDFSPNNIFQILNLFLHDHTLCHHIRDHIVSEALRFLSQTSPPTQLPLTMAVKVEVTQKVVYCLPAIVEPPPPTTTATTDSGSASEESESEICCICLEDLSNSDSKYGPICQLPHCDHLFHEVCVIKWLEHGKNSCPLLAFCVSISLPPFL